MPKEGVYIIGTVWRHFDKTNHVNINGNLTKSIKCKYCESFVLNKIEKARIHLGKYYY